MNTKLLLVLLVVGLLLLGMGISWPFFFAKEAQPSSQSPQPVSSKPANSYEFDVPANVVWFNTGLDVTGKSISIEYLSGKWSNGGSDPSFCDAAGFPPGKGDGNKLMPKLLCRNAVLGSLIAKTDNNIY